MLPEISREDSLQRNWTREQGLPDNAVNTVLHGRDGYLWLATQRGLARFDGQRFSVWDTVNTPAMGNDFCTRLAEDSEGYLWIGTRDGLLRKNGESFVRFTTKEGLADSFIVAMCASKWGGVWVGSKEGLNRIHGNQVLDYPEAGVSRRRVWSLCEDGAGILWVRSGGELLRFDPRMGAAKRFPGPDGSSLDCFVAIQSDGQPGCWAAVNYDSSHTTELYRFTEAGGQLRSSALALALNLQQDFQPLALYRTTLAWDATGFAAIPKDIPCFRDGDTALWPLPQESPSGIVLCAADDPEGNLWLGRETQGLLQWRPKRIEALTSKDGLLHDNTWTLCEASDGAVWIGTDGGVSRFKDGVCENFTQTNGLSRNEVRAIAKDRAGTIWVGTLNGLDSIRDGEVTHHRFPGEWFETKIRALLPARDGALWVGTVQGLARMHNGQRTMYASADGWGGQEVRALLEDRAGRIWIGTAGAGLRCLQGNQFSARTTTNGLSSDFVWALHEDAEGALWIGTQKGLNRFQNDRVSVFSTQQGVPETVVNCILEDDLGNIWIGHDRGIYRVRKQDLNAVASVAAQSVTCANYDEHDGLVSIETNGQKSQPAAIKARDGRLWFATTKGVAIFDPRHLPDNTNAPQMVVEQIRANGQVIYDNGPASTASANTTAHFDLRTSALRLPPASAHVLEVSYTACTFVAPEKVRFEHRLAGLDRDWIDAGQQRRATYVNLRPGHYRYEVIAGNKYGVWSAAPAGFAFYLAPYFWQTWWFYSVCTLALAGCAWAVYRWRVGELRKLQQLQHEAALLRERERLAKDLHDGLGGSLTRLTLLADLADAAQADAPDLQSRFQNVSRSTREALHAVRDLIWSAQPAYDTLESLALRICDYAENLFVTGPTQCRFDLPTPFPPQPLSSDDRREVLFVAKEALHNVVKHAAATEVSIRIAVEPSAFTIEIADNGGGFTAPVSQPSTLNSQPVQPVHGRRTMRERIEGLGGQFSLDSQPGLGTTVRLWVPLETPSTK